METNELYHYGIKGQKWGVRRYQNKNGSLTPAGKKRRRDNDYAAEAKSMSDQELRSKIDRMNLEKRYVNLSKTSKLSRALGEADRIANAGSNVGKMNDDVRKLRGTDTTKSNIAKQGLNTAAKSAKVIKRLNNTAEEGRIMKRNKTRLDSMSDKDLRDLVNRMDLEQQYSNLRAETVSRGKITTKDVLDIAGDLLAIGASATALAVSISKLKKG